MTITAETAELLRHYFIQQRSIQLPGIGSFHLNRTPATYDHAAGLLRSPQFSVEYDAAHDIPSRDLFSYISRKRDVTEWEAIGIVNNFSLGLKELLKKGQRFEWAGVGTLETQDNGHLLFQPENENISAGRDFNISGNPALQAGSDSSIDADGQFEDATVEARASWWISAAIIAAVALIMVFISVVRNDYRFSTARETRTELLVPPAQSDSKPAE